MENIGGQAPLLAANRIGTHNSDKQVCLAFCFAAAPWTGCKGNANGRPCHRVHLDCTRAQNPQVYFGTALKRHLVQNWEPAH
jgi:hypothetical protein